MKNLTDIERKVNAIAIDDKSNKTELIHLIQDLLGFIPNMHYTFNPTDPVSFNIDVFQGKHNWSLSFSTITSIDYDKNIGRVKFYLEDHYFSKRIDNQIARSVRDCYYEDFSVELLMKVVGVLWEHIMCSNHTEKHNMAININVDKNGAIINFDSLNLDEQKQLLESEIAKYSNCKISKVTIESDCGKNFESMANEEKRKVLMLKLADVLVKIKEKETI